MSEPEVRIQDDLYEAVNGEWLKTAVIPEDRPSTGGFSDLDQDVEKIMMADFLAFAAGEKSSDIPEMKYAVALYKKVLDTEKRNADGIAPVLPLLEKIRSIKTVGELNAAAAWLLSQGVELPVQVSVEGDMEDATKNSFIVAGPDIILPDTAYYAEDNPAGAQLLALYADMAAKVLAFTPLSEEEQKQFLADTLAYDALIAKKVKSQLEWSEYFKCHNPTDADEVAAWTAPFDIRKLLADLYGEQAPRILIVYDPRAVREMSGYFCEENFTLYIHWAYVKALLKATACLSEELASLGKTYFRALTGIAADPPIEKQAYQTASGMYSEPIGVYYGRTYFGEEAKKDVVDLVKKIIETYKLRMRKNGFLAASTKEQAIRKLSTIEIKMGYPDEIKPIWSRLAFDERDSLFEIMQKLYAIRLQDRLDRLTKPVDRTEWLMPGHMVNACYNPQSNDITFPAAILQKPFYSLEQSVSENLGGIGAVIGHEISRLRQQRRELRRERQSEELVDRGGFQGLQGADAGHDRAVRRHRVPRRKGQRRAHSQREHRRQRRNGRHAGDHAHPRRAGLPGLLHELGARVVHEGEGGIHPAPPEQRRALAQRAARQHESAELQRVVRGLRRHGKGPDVPRAGKAHQHLVTRAGAIPEKRSGRARPASRPLTDPNAPETIGFRGVSVFLSPAQPEEARPRKIRRARASEREA